MIALVPDESTGDRVLHVAGELTVYHAAELAAELWRRMQASPALCLDLDGVSEIDSAGVQVLLVARREARDRGSDFRLLRPSRPVLDVFELLHLQLPGSGKGCGTMSAAYPLDQGRQIFVEESRDLIRSMEAALLTLEGHPDDSEAMNALFRAAHTIKGSAGLFAFDDIVAFTHVLENVLDRVRAGRQVLEPGLMELALRCSDHVGALLDVVTATGADAGLDPRVAAVGESLIAALNGYLGKAAAAVQAAPVEGMIWIDEPAPGTSDDHGDDEANDNHPGDQVTREAWHISLRFGTDVLRRGMDPLSLLRYLGTLGEIERLITIDDHLPGRSVFDPEACYLGFELLLASTAGQQAIIDAFEFVRDECQLHVLPPHAPLRAYVDLLGALPESAERAGSLLVQAGAFTPAELATVIGWSRLPAPPSAVPVPVPVPALAAPEPKAPTSSGGAAPRAQARVGEAARFIRVPADKLDRLITLVGQLVIAGSASSTLARVHADVRLLEAAATVDGLVDEIRDRALRLRMVQMGETFQRFQRVVRDVSRELGKEIALRDHRRATPSSTRPWSRRSAIR